jgi:NAD(P)-dependent dehydrogenase (short-subunit alcohol dehydrogenase family)
MSLDAQDDPVAIVTNAASGIGQATALARVYCTRSAEGPRTLSLKSKAEFEVLQAARQREHALEFKERYAKRWGSKRRLLRERDLSTCAALDTSTKRKLIFSIF